MRSSETMPWGKYKGRFLCQVPGSYLFWLLEECDTLPDELRGHVMAELRSRLSTQPQIGVDAGVVRDWCRRAAVVCHPDTGGSTAAMKLINELRSMVL